MAKSPKTPPASKSTAAKAASSKPAAPPPAPRPLRTTGLSPREQRLQALLEKAAHKSSGAKPAPGASAQSFHAKSSGGFKKTSFQRKAV